MDIYRVLTHARTLFSQASSAKSVRINKVVPTEKSVADIAHSKQTHGTQGVVQDHRHLLSPLIRISGLQNKHRAHCPFQAFSCGTSTGLLAQLRRFSSLVITSTFCQAVCVSSHVVCMEAAFQGHLADILIGSGTCTTHLPTYAGTSSGADSKRSAQSLRRPTRTPHRQLSARHTRRQPPQLREKFTAITRIVQRRSQEKRRLRRLRIQTPELEFLPRKGAIKKSIASDPA